MTDHTPKDARGTVAELRALYEQATPAPWDAVISTGCVRYLGPPVEPAEHGDYVANCRGLDAASANSYLIAAMHDALPDLLRVVETLSLSIPDVTEGGEVWCAVCDSELHLGWPSLSEHRDDCAWALAVKLCGR